MTWFLDKEMLESFDLAAYDAERIARRIGLPLEQVRAFIDPRRMYWVKSDSYYGFLAGADAERRPCLMFVGQARSGVRAPGDLNFISFDFASDERIIASAEIDLAESSWDDILTVAENAVGFEHVGNCPVRAFVYPEVWYYAVTPFSWHHHDYLMGDEEDPEAEEDVRSWITKGNYVLQHCNAYFMSADGDVESS